ncbi:hypothetical protein GCM10022222_33260 [Amycolatopsis ultiminotia]|uniref:Antibiotic biosynthesis monooxygenase n=1 Tax=Amycolatopsis ultiminotia TaxID=543629 RepID=A0ABP6WB05_9PSEU
MHARVTKVSADEDGLAQWRRIVRTEIAPNAAGKDGFVRALWLLDRDSGHGLSVTLWDSRESLENADAAASANRGKLASATGGTVEHWYYEVVAEA